MDLTNNQLAFSFSIERILSLPKWPPVAPVPSNYTSPYSPLSISVPSPVPVVSLPHSCETYFPNLIHPASPADRSHHLHHTPGSSVPICAYKNTLITDETWRVIPSHDQSTSHAGTNRFPTNLREQSTRPTTDQSSSPLYQLSNVHAPSAPLDAPTISHRQINSNPSKSVHQTKQSGKSISSSHNGSRSRKNAHRSKDEITKLETARMENVGDLLNQDEKDSRSLNVKCRRFFRAVFTEKQRISLEKAFAVSQYIQKGPRTQLAESLGLTELQVKVWFQNRRMKWRSSKEYQSMTHKLSPKTCNE